MIDYIKARSLTTAAMNHLFGKRRQKVAQKQRTVVPQKWVENLQKSDNSMNGEIEMTDW